MGRSSYTRGAMQIGISRTGENELTANLGEVRVPRSVSGASWQCSQWESEGRLWNRKPLNEALITSVGPCWCWVDEVGQDIDGSLIECSTKDDELGKSAVNTGAQQSRRPSPLRIGVSPMITVVSFVSDSCGTRRVRRPRSCSRARRPSRPHRRHYRSDSVTRKSRLSPVRCSTSFGQLIQADERGQVTPRDR